MVRPLVLESLKPSSLETIKKEFPDFAEDKAQVKAENKFFVSNAELNAEELAARKLRLIAFKSKNRASYFYYAG